MITLKALKEALENLPINPEELDSKIPDNARIIVNPREFTLVKGYQKFGSGGYSAYYRVFYGNIQEHQLIDIREKSTQFISKTEWIYKTNPNSPLVVFTHEYDGISSSGYRPFRCELIIVNPFLSKAK